MPSPRARSGWPLRRILATAHLCIGIALGIPLVALGLTGSILVFEDELRALTGPSAPRVAPGDARSIADILDAARGRAPDARPTMILMPETSGEPVVVRFAVPGAPPGPGAIAVRVDPVSLETFDPQRPGDDWLRQVFLLHAQLFVPGRDGRWLVGWFGVAMVALGVSGIVMWWPRRRRFLAALRVDPAARGPRLYRELHGTIGIWLWCVFMAVSVSSVYLAYPETIGGAVRAVLPGRDLRPASAPRLADDPGTAPVSLDQAIAAARAAVPDGSIRTVALPLRPDQPLRVAIAPPGHRHGTPTAAVFLDPRSGEVLEVRDPRQYSAGETVLAWQHAIHAGDGFGWPWRVLVFVSGLLPTVFVVTGFAHWMLRRRHGNGGPPAGALIPL
ncbi:MAG: PepSY-associated TM helix domain-containing protein [Gemmatimonas sp.]